MNNKYSFIRTDDHWRRVFIPIWMGQVVSLVGTGLSEFALSLWVYQHTQSITQYAFVLLFRTLPVIFLSPLVGIVVDHWDRRKVMIFSDSGSALCSVVIAGLFLSDQLQPWQVIIATALSAGFGALQAPAYLSTVSSIVPKESLGRVNGLLQLGQAVSEILVPAMAASLMAILGLSGVILIDFSTFLVAVTTLVFVRFTCVVKNGQDENVGFVQSFLLGINYLKSRSELVSLLSFNVGFTFFSGMLEALFIPLFMGITTVEGMGLALTIAGCGVLGGSLLLSFGYGGRSYRKNIFMGSLVFGAALMCAGINSNVIWVGIFILVAHFCWPIIQGATQALWQSAVNHEIQGRVFATRQMILRSVQPVSLLLAGYAADTFFEPSMQDGGVFAGFFGRWLSTGPGRGAALLVACIGLVIVIISAIFSISQSRKSLN